MYAIIRKDGAIAHLSNFGGFLVKPWPTKVTLEMTLFQAFFLRLPDFITLNTYPKSNLIDSRPYARVEAPRAA